MHNAIINRNDLHLLQLLRGYPRLRHKLARASVVPADRVPVDVVTMNSKVQYCDETLGVAHDVLVAMLVLGVFFFHRREQFDSLDLHHLESLREDQ